MGLPCGRSKLLGGQKRNEREPGHGAVNSPHALQNAVSVSLGIQKIGRMISYHQAAASLFKEALSRLRAPARAALYQTS